MESIKAVCITLDPESHTRAQTAIKEIRKLGFKNVSFSQGVDARKLKDIKKYLSPRANYELENSRYVHEALSGIGAVGCYLAHAKAWRKCLDENKSLAIFEDDFVGTEGADKKIQEVLREANEIKFDVLRLQHRPNPDYGEEVEDIPRYPHIVRMKRTEGGTAYIITPKAAEVLLSTHLPIEMQVDSYLDMACIYHNLNYISSKENFFNDPELKSVIGHNEVENYPDRLNSNTARRHWKCILFIVILMLMLVLLLLRP